MNKDASMNLSSESNNLTWTPGEVVTLPANEGQAMLVNRLGTYPTTKSMPLARWEVARWDVGLRDYDKKDLIIRPLFEVGKNNEDYPDFVDYSKYTLSPKEVEVNEVKAVAVPSAESKGRGRPEGPMSLIKSQNLIRLWKKKEKTTDEIMEAVDWLIDNGWEDYAEKHVFKNLVD